LSSGRVPLLGVVGAGGVAFLWVTRARVRARAREVERARYRLKPRWADISAALSITSGVSFSRA
jgi:hypothetical protein